MNKLNFISSGEIKPDTTIWLRYNFECCCGSILCEKSNGTHTINLNQLIKKNKIMLSKSGKNYVEISVGK